MLQSHYSFQEGAAGWEGTFATARKLKDFWGLVLKTAALSGGQL